MNWIPTIILWSVYLVSLYFSVFWLLVFLDRSAEDEKKPVLKGFPQVTIAVPAYNEEKNIKETLESIRKLEYPKEKILVIVVDDGSTDRTSGIIKKYRASHPEMDLLLLWQENKGKGAALNNAIANAKGDYFIVFDADSEIQKDALTRMLPYFDEKDIAAVLPMLKIKSPKNLIERMQWYEYILNMFYKKLMAHLNCVHVAPGPFSIYKVNALRRIGGFDEDRNLTEDLELTLRLQRHHYRLIQLMDVVALTKGPKTLKTLYRQRNRWFKGATINAWNYRDMLFNKKYGHFGMIQMPTILIAGLLSLTIILSTVYYALKPYVVYFYRMSFVGFDFWTMLYDLTLNFHILDIKIGVVAVGLLMTALSIFLIMNAHKFTGERLTSQGIFPLLTFVLFYYLLLGVIWAGVAIDLLKRKRQRW